MADVLMIPGTVISMTGAAVDRLLAAGNGDAALLYLYLLRKGPQFDPPACAKTLHWLVPRAEAAFEALVQGGLADRRDVQSSAPLAPPDEPPAYSAADITRELDDRESVFPRLVAEVQRRLGKVLSTSDLQALYSIYDYLALPAEVIMLLVSWCVEEATRRYGAGRMPRMPQIQREARLWRQNGVDTAETAEAYLKRKADLHTREKSIRRLLGLSGERALIAEEHNRITSWIDLGFDDGAIRLAYERTILKKQTLDWRYMNSIMNSWHKKNLHTCAEIEAGDTNERPYSKVSAPSPAPNAPPGEADQRARADWERVRAFMKKQREDDKEE